MKINLFCSAAIAMVVGLSAISMAADKPKGPTTKPAATQPAKAINKFCAVEGEDHEVDPKVTVVYKGKTIGFCCKDCVEEFQKDPEKYVKRLK